MSSYKSFVYVIFFFAFISVVVVSGPALPCLAQSQPSTTVPNPALKFSKRLPNITPEASLGERLFLETRFAQYFAVHSNGDMNHPLAEGDPVVARVLNPRAGVSYPSPFAGKSMNCRSCHFVDEFSTLVGGMNRTYADFLPRTPLPYRGDGRIVTTRNARDMVDNFTVRHPNTLLQGDGLFASPESLARAGLTGRHFGWLPQEHEQAVHHVANVIREDDGQDELGKQYGGSYAKMFLGTASDLPNQFPISSDFRIDVATATDQQILDELARLLAVFLKSLQFEHAPSGIHTGSAYDMFLARNGLPALPAEGESDVQYSRRLSEKLDHLQSPKFVMPYERWLRFHPHVLEFGEQELAGLKIFLRQSAPGSQNLSVSHAGNCFACHPAPDFTDVRFHNTGAAQEEYDSLHGAGSFAQLPVPSYAERILHPDQYVLATRSHPHATSVFDSLPAINRPSATDLGMWNIYANPDFPDVQHQMSLLLCDTRPCDPNVQLPLTIALFRTPTLRDLGHSWPYLHTGRMGTVEDVLHYYIRMSGLAKAGQLRNGDPELRQISLDEEDVVAVTAFLRALDEDYDN